MSPRKSRHPIGRAALAYLTFGETAYAARMRLGMTQADVMAQARSLGVRVPHLTQVERGEVLMSDAVIDAYAAVLQLDTADVTAVKEGTLHPRAEPILLPVRNGREDGEAAGASEYWEVQIIGGPRGRFTSEVKALRAVAEHCGATVQHVTDQPPLDAPLG